MTWWRCGELSVAVHCGTCFLYPADAQAEHAPGSYARERRPDGSTVERVAIAVCPQRSADMLQYERQQLIRQIAQARHDSTRPVPLGLLGSGKLLCTVKIASRCQCCCALTCGWTCAVPRAQHSCSADTDRRNRALIDDLTLLYVAQAANARMQCDHDVQVHCCSTAVVQLPTAGRWQASLALNHCTMMAGRQASSKNSRLCVRTNVLQIIALAENAVGPLHGCAS